MNLIDILDLYAMVHESTDLFLMLEEYTLDDRLSREKLNRAMLSRLGNMRCISNSPDVMKVLIEEFFNRYNWNITRLFDTMVLDYEPLENYKLDRVYDGTEHRESDADVKNEDSTVRNRNLKNTRGTEDKVSAYDSSSYQPKSREDETIGENEDSTNVATGTSDIDSTTDTKDHQVTSESGKLGDESYQSLIERERKLAEFNIYNWILDLMKKELFILLY